MGLPGCLFVCHLILLLVCFLFNCKYSDICSCFEQDIYSFNVVINVKSVNLDIYK